MRLHKPPSTATVSDAEQTVTCKLNDTNPESGASTPFVFTDRSSVVFKGSDAVSQGQFTFTFAVPKDISYSDGTGLINFLVRGAARDAAQSYPNRTFGFGRLDMAGVFDWIAGIGRG